MSLPSLLLILVLFTHNLLFFSSSLLPVSFQVNELKDLLDVQKTTHGNLVKELINDLATERKKVAMLQIEIDRLIKLTAHV